MSSLKDDIGWICDGCGGRLKPDPNAKYDGKYCPVCQPEKGRKSTNNKCLLGRTYENKD